jgi:hypothetical protein
METPGPGQYSPIVNAGKGPRFTLKSRQVASEKLPYDPNYVVLPSTVGEGAPKIAMGLRLHGKKSDKVPGPDYMPPPLGSDAKKIGFSSHGGLEQKKKGKERSVLPGPGAYDVKPVFGNESVKYTLHQRTMLEKDDTVSPGPAAYAPSFAAVKPRVLAASMHIRPQVKVNEKGPGYLNLGSTLTGKGVTIGRKETLDLVRVA